MSILDTLVTGGKLIGGALFGRALDQIRGVPGIPDFNIPAGRFGRDAQVNRIVGGRNGGDTMPGAPPSMSGQVQVIGGRCVTSPPAPRGMRAVWTADGVFCGWARKRRRMNVLNPRALTRALRRIEGYSKVNKRVEKSLRRVSPPRRRTAARKPC